MASFLLLPTCLIKIWFCLFERSCRDQTALFFFTGCNAGFFMFYEGKKYEAQSHLWKTVVNKNYPQNRNTIPNLG